MATKKPAAAPAPEVKKAAPKKPGTAIAVKKASGGAVVDIRAAMAAELAALSERTGSAGGDTIQLKDKLFHMPDGTQVDTLDVVIVDFININNFYEAKYDAKNIVPPTCFAIGQVITTMAPSDNAPLKQSDVCSTCPMNQFGSDGDGKACKNMRRLAVLPPDGDADTPLLILNVSPTGLKSFDGYVRSVASKFGVMPVGVVTTVSFDENVSYGSLRFSNPQPNEMINDHWARRTEAMDRLAQEPDVSSYSSNPPPKPGRKPAARPAARR